jgi:hypothetical protein
MLNTKTSFFREKSDRTIEIMDSLNDELRFLTFFTVVILQYFFAYYTDLGGITGIERMVFSAIQSIGFAPTVVSSHFAKISVLTFEVQEGHQIPLHSRA